MWNVSTDPAGHQAGGGGEGMIELVDVSRRRFLGQIFSTGALVIGSPFALTSAFGQGGKTWQPSVYLGIEANGDVKIVAHRSEMGTGVRTCLPMIVADELEADWKRVTIVQALGDAKYGSQNTDGSRSVRDFYDAMRTAGAGALNHAGAGSGKQVGSAAGRMPGQESFRVIPRVIESCRMANWCR